MTSVEIAKQTAKWESELHRMSETAEYLDFYYNRQEDYIKAEIKEKYPKIYQDLYKYIGTYPLTETITNDTSLLFTQPCVLKFDGLSETQNELLKTAIDKSQINKYLLTLNRLTNLTFKVGILPRYVDGKIVYDILTGDRVWVEQNPDDCTQATDVYYSIGIAVDSPHQVDKVCTFMHWTKEYYAKCDINVKNGAFLPGKVDYDKKPNPYGYIPITWFSSDVELDSFWFDKGNPVVEANEQGDLDLTNLNLIKDFQAFSLLVTNGLPEDKTIPFSPQYFLNFPGTFDGKPSGDAKYITPSPMITEIWQIMNDQNTNIAKMKGLSADAFNRNTTSFNSGYQLRLSKQDALNKNILDRELYREPIKQLVQTIADTLTIYSDYQMPKDIMITVDFGEVKFDSNPLEVEQIRATKKANGTANVIDFIMEDNPDITTREEAIILYQQRQAELTALNITNQMAQALDVET